MTEEATQPKRAFWTNKMEEQLRQLWADGYSTAIIASMMGGGLTKNSIIGKAHRIKLPLRTMVVPRKSGRPPNPKAKAKPAPKPKRPRLDKVPPAAPAFPPAEKPKGEAWKPIEGITPVTLTDLENGQCKWPVTEDAPFLFCGAHATHGSYCHHHHHWSIGQGTAFERAAIAKARLAVFKERAIPDPHREAA